MDFVLDSGMDTWEMQELLMESELSPDQTAEIMELFFPQ